MFVFVILQLELLKTYPTCMLCLYLNRSQPLALVDPQGPSGICLQSRGAVALRIASKVKLVPEIKGSIIYYNVMRVLPATFSSLVQHTCPGTYDEVGR